MEGLLTPVSTSYKSPDQEKDDALVEVQLSKPASGPARSFSKASTPGEALEILQNEPDYESLISTLRWLALGTADFSIFLPSPSAAQIVHVLVSETLPTYWSTFQAQAGKKGRGKSRSRLSSDLESLLTCLRSVTGLNALLLNLRQFIQKSKEPKKAAGSSDIQGALRSLIQVICALLEGEEAIEALSKTIWNSQESIVKQKAIWSEFLSIIAGGKILGIAAEAEDVINRLSKEVGDKNWVAEGTTYSKWLASNISRWAFALKLDEEGGWRACAELLSKSFRLGHTEGIIAEIIVVFLLQSRDGSTRFQKLLAGLPSFDQKTFLFSALQIVSKHHLSSIVISEDDLDWWRADAGVVSAAAGLLAVILGNDLTRKAQLVSWLTGSSGAGVGDGISIRRAAIAAVAVEKGDIELVLEKSLLQFGDQLYIRHTPTMQQEVHAQVLLLSAGYVHRKSPLRLNMMMRQGTHLSVVSNRLSSSSPQARFLGMIVGEALSGLVDKGDKKMDFKMDEMSTSEAKWYKSLVGVSDTIGSLDALKSKSLIKVPKKSQPPKTKPPQKSTVVQGGSKIIAIEEIEDDSEEEEQSSGDGLTPYAKPDSDAEDSDEDATLITRNKPTAPVYIRDLISYLRDSESYDKQKLGLLTAAPLIRRKATFGTEVSAHAEELASLLVGLQDKYEMDDFADMRLQGMIAVLMAKPKEMGQWFSKTFFDGDYSISQRASILTTLGLSARELGGLSNSSSTTTKPPSFPSKALPPKMHALYSSPPAKTTKPLLPSAIDSLTTQLTNTFITPLAASLADKATGPDLLKVRTFSTRMAVESSRAKPTTNALAPLVATSFFFPLTARFLIHIRSSSSSRPTITQPHLLALFLRTLSLILHAAGSSNMSLPQMTSEFFDLLLGLRGRAIGDIGVVEGLLFGFLTLLEVNQEKRGLVEAHGREMLETQEWVEGVFSRLGGRGTAEGEDERVRLLAASVLMRIREVVEKYQALLMGDMASFRG